MTRSRDRQILLFFFLAYLFSWAYWVPMLVRGVRVGPDSAATHFPGLLGPALAACFVTAWSEDVPGLRRLLRRMVHVSQPAARFWYYALSPLLFLAAALGTLATLGTGLPAMADFAHFSGLPDGSLALVLAIAFIIGGYGEELGWRGFALERLQGRFGALGGTIVLGMLWAGWHAPLFGIIDIYRQMTLPMILGGFVLGITAGSIVLAHIAHETGGSVFAVALWHTLYNLASGTSAGGGFIAAFTTTGVILWALVLVGLEWRSPGSRLSTRSPTQ